MTHWGVGGHDTLGGFGCMTHGGGGGHDTQGVWEA